ncbi:MAG: ATP-dependent DNA helicase RecG, partial [Prevotella sp.]|nr:ATP-dependent DNA helicase RecG [Prevotella sp.]
MYVPGVGPHRKELLKKELGIETFGDLLEYYPYKYVDRSKIYQICEINGEMPFVQIKGEFLDFEEFSMGARKKRIVAHFTDGTGYVDIVWFARAQQLTKNLKVGTEYIIFGKPTVFGGRYQFVHPEIDLAKDVELSTMGMQPYYNTTEKMKKAGMTSHAVEKITKNMLARIQHEIPETLPPFIVNRLRLVSRDSALRHI